MGMVGLRGACGDRERKGSGNKKMGKWGIWEVMGMRRTMQKWAWSSYDNFRRYTVDGLIGF